VEIELRKYTVGLGYPYVEVKLSDLFVDVPEIDRSHHLFELIASVNSFYFVSLIFKVGQFPNLEAKQEVLDFYAAIYS
jgi:hypothetical protein